MIKNMNISNFYYLYFTILKIQLLQYDLSFQFV